MAKLRGCGQPKREEEGFETLAVTPILLPRMRISHDAGIEKVPEILGFKEAEIFAVTPLRI